MPQPKRRKPKSLGVREDPQIRNASHLKFVRGFECSARGTAFACTERIEAAHVRTGTDGALGVKPSDCWAIPLCTNHHAEQHNIGERAFEAKHRIDMRKIAIDLWAKSPHRYKSEQP